MKSKMTKRLQAGRKMKFKERKEWARDQIREADEDQMAFITSNLTKFRNEDKVHMRRGNRNCNTGGNNPLANVYVEPSRYNKESNLNPGGSHSAARPPSSQYASSTVPL